MRILLVNPPGWQSGSVSLGLGYLAAILAKDGHEVRVLDETGKPLAPEAVALKAAAFRPGIIGFHCKTAQANACSRISAAVKRAYPGAMHVIGGPHITLCYEEYLRENPDFEYGFLGEADVNFSDFVRRVEAGRPVRDIPGLAYRDGDRVVGTERELITALDELPRPDFDLIEGFSWADFRYPLLTSRGCPYKCNFCSVPIISSKRFRARSPQDCIDELAQVRRAKGITSFEILDDNLTLNMKRAKEFCAELKASRLGLSWYCHNGIRADRLDQELADMMAEAGCTSIAFGIESGDQDVFRRVVKGEELEHIVHAIDMTKKAGMKTVGYFIIGLPGDNPEAVKRTIAFQRTLDLDHYVYGIFIPYPGTTGREDVLREGRVIRDIKETNHFSDKPQISVEYPYFTKEQIEDSYCLATAGELADLMDSRGLRGSADKILFVETDPATYGFRRFIRLLNGRIDVLVNPAYDGSYEADRREGTVGEVHTFPRSPNRFQTALSLLGLFRELRARRYQLALWPVRWRGSRVTDGLAFCAFLALARPRHAVVYDFASCRFVEFAWRNRKVFADYAARHLMGEAAAGGPLAKAGWLARRVLRLAGRAAALVAGEVLGRAIYPFVLVSVALRRPRGGGSSAGPA